MTIRATFALLSILAAAALSGCGGSSAPPGSPLQAFLAAHHLDGKIVLLQFSNVEFDCEKSRAGLDAMIRLNRAGTIPGLEFARVEGSADDDKVNEYFAGKSCGFTIIRDGAAAKAFDVTVLPTVVLLDRFGRVRLRGAFPAEKDLAGWVASLREQKEDAGADVTLFGAKSMKPVALLAATSLPDLSGVIKPLADYRDRGGLVVVFADTTCPFAESALGEMPQVAKVLRLYRIAAVTVNISDAKGDVLSTYADRNTGTPVVYDVTDATKENWAIDSVPTVVFINANGQVGYRGPAVWKDLAAAVEKSSGLAPGTVDFTVQGSGGG